MEERKTFHQANLIALKKIGVANVSNIFSKNIIKNKIEEHIYNATNVFFSNEDETHSILEIQFGNVKDEFILIWEKNENGTYKLVAIK